MLFVVLCVPALAETGKFGGYYVNGKLTDQATWTLNNGNLVISGGVFNRIQWVNLIERISAASISFNGTRLVLKNGETETSLETTRIYTASAAAEGAIPDFAVCGCCS